MSAALQDLLDRLQQATITADFAMLGQLAPEVEAALLAFDPRQDPAAARQIARKARQNARCLDAARRGLRAARRRLADLRDIGQRQRSYDRNGQPTEILPPVLPTRRF